MTSGLDEAARIISRMRHQKKPSGEIARAAGEAFIEALPEDKLTFCRRELRRQMLGEE